MNELWQAIIALAAVASLLTAGFVAAVGAIVRKETASLREWADERYARKEDLDRVVAAVCAYPRDMR